ncbi:AI-2E family transporter [Haloferax elongans]|uniref:AI-2E family transporter n=1 Tax=Haloferax elongans TaxID=403191 RepID=UPI0006777C4C|nr:AI-2E family transporter [Haloferax elongans]
MTNSRPYVLGGVLALTAIAAAVILVDVLATVFFAITVAYLLIPLRRRLETLGTTRWVSSVIATVAAGIGVVAVLSPLVIIFLLRLDVLLELASLVPDTISFELFGVTFVETVEEIRTVVFSVLRSVGQSVATAAPVLLIKLTLAGFLVFALLLSGDSVGKTLLALVPEEYRFAARALNARCRETLFAIYVLQAATAFGTFFIALAVFWALGYTYVITLSTVAAVLQFIPIVGPSFLLAGMAIYHLAVGEVVAAVLVVFVGGFAIAWLPDILIRPRLAKETADLPGSLYFVGFVGGLLSLGPIGIIAGPLVVALVVEAVNLLGDELNVEDEAPPATSTPTLSDFSTSAESTKDSATDSTEVGN